MSDDKMKPCPFCGSDTPITCEKPPWVKDERLADLLAALQAIVKHQDIMGGSMARMSTTRRIAMNAIAKATGQLK